MKLTGELKEKVANAESAEQAKDIIAEVGVELTDEEVEDVAGGIYGAYNGCYGGGQDRRPASPGTPDAGSGRLFRAR